VYKINSRGPRTDPI